MREAFVEQITSRLESEAGGMAILSFTWEQVKVEISNQTLLRSSFSIVDCEHSDSRSPHLSILFFDEFEVQAVFVKF
jgi:hypothetical protein